MATTGGFCGNIGSAAAELVQEGWAAHRNNVTTVLGAADALAGQLSDFIEEIPVHAVNTNITWSLTGDFGTTFGSPVPPEIPAVNYEKPNPITLREISPITGPSIGTVPLWTAVRPSYDLSGQPSPLDDNDIPTDPPTLSDPDSPITPTLTLPTLDDLRTRLLAINIESASPIDFVEFGGVRPTDNLPTVSNNFNWTEETYTSALMSSTQAEISRLLAGGSGLPNAIWDLIIDRDLKAQNEANHAYLDSVTDLWGRHGWDTVGGEEAEMLRKANQDVLNVASERLRNILIQQSTQEIEQLRFAVSQGVAMENVAIGLFTARQGRALQAAQFVEELSINILQAAIARLNANAQLYATDAQVYRDRIAGQLATLEERKLYLDEQRIKGDLNDQELRIWLGQYEAADKAIRLFLAEWQGVQAQVDIDKAKVQLFAERIRAAGEKRQIKALEYQGWETKIRGQLGLAQLYDTDAKVFSERMRGVEIQAKKEATRIDAEAKIRELLIRQTELDSERYKIESTAELERIKADVMNVDAAVRKYEAEGKIEQARVESDTNRFRAAVEELRAHETLELEAAKINSDQIMRLLALEQDGVKNLVQVRSQLVASMYSAFNLSASMSDSVGQSFGCSTNYSVDQTAEA